MDTHDVVEEGSSDRLSRVGVDLCDEVSHLGEAVNDVRMTDFPLTHEKPSTKSMAMLLQTLACMGSGWRCCK